MAAQRLRNVQRGFGDQLLDALERNAVLFLSRDSSCSTVRGRLYPIFHFMMLQMFSLVKVVQPLAFLPQSHAVVFDADLVLSSWNIQELPWGKWIGVHVALKPVYTFQHRWCLSKGASCQCLIGTNAPPYCQRCRQRLLVTGWMVSLVFSLQTQHPCFPSRIPHLDCFALPQMLNELRPKEGSSVSVHDRFNPHWTVLTGNDFWVYLSPCCVCITELMSAFNAVPLNDPKIQHPGILSLAHCARRFPKYRKKYKITYSLLKVETFLIVFVCLAEGKKREKDVVKDESITLSVSGSSDSFSQNHIDLKPQNIDDGPQRRCPLIPRKHQCCSSLIQSK